MRLALVLLSLTVACTRSNIGLDPLPDGDAIAGADAGAAAPDGRPLPQFEAGLALAPDTGEYLPPPRLDAALATTDTSVSVDLRPSLPPDASAGSDASHPMACPSNNGCTDQQNQAYSNCVIDWCDSQYQACLGPTYRTGPFSGPCGTYLTCTQKCPCGDEACRTACGSVDGACYTCILQIIYPCVMSAGCAQPVCQKLDAGVAPVRDAGIGGCAELMRCCASMTNASLKMACEAQYNALKGAPDTGPSCSQLAGQYRTAGYCTF